MAEYTNRPSTPGTFSLAIWVVASLLAAASGLAVIIGGGMAEFAELDVPEDETGPILIATGVLVVALNLVMILVAVRMWRGAMWAQWFLTLAGAASLVALHTGAGQELVVWLHTFAVIVAIVLMWGQPAAVRSTTR